MLTFNMPRERGFTLIEMSIVLIIIGLIIGGILKGQELIESARQKNLISQIDSIRAGTNTFIDRFKSFPGDYGTASTNINASLGNGNDDGVLATAVSNVAALLGVNGAAASSENKEFFNHLIGANLIGGGSVLIATSAATAFGGGAVASPLPGAAYPQSGLTIVYGTHEGLTTNGESITANWLRLHRFVAGTLTTATTVVAPARSYQLDQKYDDGTPTGGRIRTDYLKSATTGDCGSASSAVYTATRTNGGCHIYIGLE